MAPRTNAEIVISDVWCDMLGIERIRVYENFFDIGGHSMLAVRAIMKIAKQMGVRLNQANLVRQTLKQLAADCAKRMEPALEPTQ